VALIDNLEYYYQLDEASGTFIDAHGSADLTDNNGTGTGTGKLNGARDFEAGSGQYGEHAQDSVFDVGDEDFSWWLWINAETLATFPVILSKKKGGGINSYALYYDTDTSKLTFGIVIGTTDYAVQWGSALSTATWYHVYFEHDSVNNHLGISVNNGTLVTQAHTVGLQIGSGVFQLGASSGQSLYFDGLIDEFGASRRCLGTTDRTTAYGGGTPPPYPFASAFRPRPHLMVPQRVKRAAYY
jgi:hypothetical protein